MAAAGWSTVALAAIERIERLVEDGWLSGKTVLLAEAFCSHKPQPSGHIDDAKRIRTEFGSIEPAPFGEGDRRPISRHIHGISPAGVFRHPSLQCDG